MLQLQFTLCFMTKRGEIVSSINFKAKDLEEGFDTTELIIKRLTEPLKESSKFRFKFKPLDAKCKYIEINIRDTSAES